jgi:hypothetical protein
VPDEKDENLRARFKRHPNEYGRLKMQTLSLPSENPPRRYLPLLLIVVLAVLVAGPAAASSLVYKNYIVRYDRGWDILCEPYVVEKGDWVLKIFRQKGELAHYDFREFLGIFQRLNPHVQDIDLLRPGQTIEIPLRKLEHGALPGQAGGMVTIPFVSLTRVIDVLHKNLPTYKIQRGDTVSKLISERFGRYGSEAYQEGLKLLQAANPQITDINLIYAGSTLHMPDPTVRQQQWYHALYDEKGDLRETSQPPGTPGASTADARAGAWATDEDDAAAEPAQPADVIAAAAAAVGGRFMNKGTYFAPQPGEEDFEIDLSRHPLLNLDSGSLLFSPDGQVMNQPPAALQQNWPALKVVSYDPGATATQLVGAIFNALNGAAHHPEAETFVVEDGGVIVTVTAKWSRIDTDQRRLCIVPINDRGEQTPESMRRYLEQHGLVLRELLPNGRIVSGGSERGAGRHAIKDILVLTRSGQREFVQRLARALNFTYAPGVAVTFPYAGIQLRAHADLVTSPDGHQVLVDFGELYGDTLAALQESGHKVVQIAAGDPLLQTVRIVFGGLGVAFSENPSFPAAARPARFNTRVTVPGILYVGPDNKRTLLSEADLPPAVTDVLSTGGIAVVKW